MSNKRSISPTCLSRVIAVLVVIMAVYVSIVTFYEYISDGRVGDHLCDICYDSIYRDGSVISSGDAIIHEYCPRHTFIHRLIHPILSTKSALINDFKQKETWQPLAVWLVLIILAVILIRKRNRPPQVTTYWVYPFQPPGRR